ncbi:MAG: hypothetical protein Q9227_006475 [Pyrenula ochraceoflavens]
MLQVLTNPLATSNVPSPAVPAPTPKATLANSLDKRVDTTDIVNSWKFATNKVAAGDTTGFSIDRTKETTWTTDIFWDCTVVVIADGKHVIIGHFMALKSTPPLPCVNITDENDAQDHIVGPLEEAQNAVDFLPGPDTGTIAWIITPGSSDSKGYSAVSEWMALQDILQHNIHYYHYKPSGWDNIKEHAPQGKVVVSWAWGNAGGGTIDIFIESNAASTRACYDCNGDPMDCDRSVDDQPKCTPPPPTNTFPTLGPIVTDSAACKICTPDTQSDSTCNPIPSCTIQKPKAQIQLGSSPVHVGTLTGDKLSSSVSNALTSLCPKPSKAGAHASCATHTAEIHNIDYVDDDQYFQDGKLEISVDVSSYNDTTLRDTIINTIAYSVMHGANNTKNCRTQNYLDDQPSGKDGGPTEPKDVTGCDTVSAAGVQWFDKYWRWAEEPGAQDWISAKFEFRKGAAEQMECKELADMVSVVTMMFRQAKIAGMELQDVVEMACEGEFDPNLVLGV